jgi:outer membrane usher protein FimD/PapC
MSATAATTAAAIAVRAAGTLVELDSEQFSKIATKLQQENGALIIHGQTGFRQKKDTYLVGNQGVILYCKNLGVLASLKVDVEAKSLSLLL